MKELSCNAYLTEAMGECWHEHDCCPDKDSGGITYHCDKCGQNFSFSWDECRAGGGMPYNDFTKPDGFFKLWRWGKQQEWWYDFWKIDLGVSVITERLIDPDVFATEIHRFLKDRD